MKSCKLLVASALALQVAGFGVAFAKDSSPFPSDADADYNLPALESRADRIARMGGDTHVAFAQASSPFPSDADADYNLPALETHVDRIARTGGGTDETWGVSPRQGHDPFPNDNAPYGVKD